MFEETELKIRHLSESVINQISAGEIILKPVNVVKEVIENSIDANSSTITIKIEKKKIKSIQVDDNGEGIFYQDLPLVCSRFATSKLNVFDDLKILKTLGFRGEALSSISMVANVVITSKIKNSTTGYKCEYLNGEKVQDIVPVVCNNGTSVIVKNLFYNVPIRRKTLDSLKDYYKIIDVIQSFSIHFYYISFICQLTNKNSLSFFSTNTESCTILQDGSHHQNKSHTIQNRDFLTRQCIRKIFGELLEKSLNTITFSNIYPNLKLFGYLSTDFQIKKKNLILFVNNRLVHHKLIKKLLDQVYYECFHSKYNYWVYLSIEVPLDSLDFNINPEKKNVQFKYEDSIMYLLKEKILFTLKQTNNRISLKTYSSFDEKDIALGKNTLESTTLKNGIIEYQAKSDIDIGNYDKEFILSIPSKEKTPSTKEYLKICENDYNICSFTNETDAKYMRNDKKMSPQNSISKIKLYTDRKQNTLLQYYDESHKEKKENELNIDLENIPNKINDNKYSNYATTIKKYFIPINTNDLKVFRIFSNVHPLLTTNSSVSHIDPSVHSILMNKFLEQSNDSSSKLVYESSFVGVVDNEKVLIQHDNKMYIINISLIFHYTLYQSIISRLGNLPYFCMKYPFPLKNFFGEKCVNTKIHSLFSVFKNYFSIHLNDKDFSLEKFPLCCGTFFPGIPYIKTFFISITDYMEANQYDYKNTDSLSLLIDYITLQLVNMYRGFPECCSHEVEDHWHYKCTLRHQLLEYVFYQCIINYTPLLLPNNLISESSMVIKEIAHLDTLYRTFERC